MSHIVEIRCEVRDLLSVRSACRHLGLDEPTHGTFTVFRETLEGVGIQLADWKYPVVCDLQSGKVFFDNFDGLWGEKKELDRFLQRYAVERTAIEARRNGYSVLESMLEDGSIKLTLNVGDSR